MVPAAGTPFLGLQTRFSGNSSSHRIAAFDFAGKHRTQSCRAERCTRCENVPPDHESVGNCPHTNHSLAVCPTQAPLRGWRFWVRYPGNVATVWAIAPDADA